MLFGGGLPLLVGGDFTEAVDQEVLLNQFVDVVTEGTVKADADAAILTGIGLHGDGKRGQVTVYAAILQFALFVVPPATLTRDAEAGMTHEDDHAPAFTQRPTGSVDYLIERFHVFDAQHKDDGIKGGGG